MASKKDGEVADDRPLNIDGLRRFMAGNYYITPLGITQFFSEQMLTNPTDRHNFVFLLQDLWKDASKVCSI
jgi:hypothetical protein